MGKSILINTLPGPGLVQRRDNGVDPEMRIAEFLQLVTKKIELVVFGTDEVFSKGIIMVFHREYDSRQN